MLTVFKHVLGGTVTTIQLQKVFVIHTGTGPIYFIEPV